MYMSCSNLAQHPNTSAVVTQTASSKWRFDPDRPVVVKKWICDILWRQPPFRQPLFETSEFKGIPGALYGNLREFKGIAVKLGSFILGGGFYAHRRGFPTAFSKQRFLDSWLRLATEAIPFRGRNAASKHWFWQMFWAASIRHLIWQCKNLMYSKTGLFISCTQGGL